MIIYSDRQRGSDSIGEVCRFEFTSLNPSPSNATVTSQTTGSFSFSGTRHDRLGAWFLGPKAENIGFLKQFLNSVADQTEHARLAYQPEDPKFIGKEMQASAVFQKEMSELDVALKELVGALSEHSIPFWSPRYNAHMNGDTSLPGLLGYLAAALFNPNNVCTESNVGYNISNTESSKPWGHILWWLCGQPRINVGGTQYEILPLSLACAMEPAETVFDIPERLQSEYAISAGALSTALNPYLIQTCGKDGAAVTGIGSEHIIDVPVDIDARMSIPSSTSSSTSASSPAPQYTPSSPSWAPPSTAQSTPSKAPSVSPLPSTQTQHGEGTMPRSFTSPTSLSNGSIVPEQALSDYTRSQLEYAVRRLDHHRPAQVWLHPVPGRWPVLPGRADAVPCDVDEPERVQGLGRDGEHGSVRDRRKQAGCERCGCVAVASDDRTASTGTGRCLESRCSAAPRSTRTGRRWTMDDSSLIVCRSRRSLLSASSWDRTRSGSSESTSGHDREPTERGAGARRQGDVAAARDGVGPAINAFACNFRLPNGEVNSDVVEANYLNTRIYERLSVTKPDGPEDVRGVRGGVQVAAGSGREQDLDILVNVMSPFPTVANFTKSVTDAFKRIAHEEIKQTTTDVSCDVPLDVMERYREAKAEDPSAVFMLSTASPVELTSILAGSFKGVLQKRLAAGIELTLVQLDLRGFKHPGGQDKRLDSKYLDLSYSDEMYFYLTVSLDLTEGRSRKTTSLVSFPLTPRILYPDSQQKITVFRDPHAPGNTDQDLPRHASTSPIASGKIRFGTMVHTDSVDLNANPLPKGVERPKSRDRPHAPGKYGPGLTQAYASTSPIASGKIRFGTMVHTDSVDLNANPLPKGVERPKSRDVSKMTLAERLDAARASMAPLEPSAEKRARIPKRRVVELESSTLKPGYKVGSSLAMFMIVTLFVLAAFTLCRRF
ncbi:pyridoxal-dependent decarboxylase domain protein [Rhizoctonia solani]|uniref:Pyridoxal-dependent decarboxylase domain protein n=1 Tax=Rhizoctonia solani TaxID=456999 RepID=A0A8H8NRH8_9AGAM|nr:pyridoxal-dependent decarboxylase domain protein [Rhizoctonia solani]QRW18661.1 pyridoxal-dependent decarboxylase domain protein [Rhizoctonia solani]